MEVEVFEDEDDVDDDDDDVDDVDFVFEDMVMKLEDVENN